MTDTIWKTTGKVFATVTTLVGIPSAIYFFVDQARFDAARWLIVESTQGVPLTAGNYLIADILLFTVAVALVAAIGSWVVLLLSHRIMKTRIARAQVAGQAASDSLAAAKADSEMQEAYDAMCEAVQRVVYPSFNAGNPILEPPPPLLYRSIQCEFSVAQNGDASVSQVYEVQAIDKSARFLTIFLAFDELAFPFKTLQSINFKAQPLTSGTAVESVTLYNRGNQRTVGVFFLPEIAKDHIRRFRIRFNWPNWFRQLVLENSTEWNWSYLSKDVENEVEVSFKFIFAKELSPVHCEFTNFGSQGGTLKSHNEGGQTCWIYSNSRVSASKLKWQLRFFC